MVRCSLTGRDQKTGGFTAESPKVVPAFRTGSAGHGFVARCAEQFVGNLDPETRLVVLLGNSDGYSHMLFDFCVMRITMRRSMLMAISSWWVWKAGSFS